MIKKMSKRQFILLFMMLVASPVIRGLPLILAETSKQAAWITPLVSVLLLFGLMLVMNEIFKKHQGKNLIDICFSILTKPVGIAIGVIYFIWIMILLGYYLRLFGEQIVSNIMNEASLHFIIITMLILVGIVLTKSIVYYARLNEVVFSCFMLVFISVSLISLFTKVKIDNLLPISNRDIIPILKGSVSGLSVFGYYMFIFFMFDDVHIQKNNLKLEIKSTSALWLLSLTVLVITIGSIGPEAVLKFSDPYFMITKNVDILGFLERLDAILLIMWIMADFTTIAIFTYMNTSLITTIFKIKRNNSSRIKPNYITYLILIAAYFIAIYGFNSKFMLEWFAKELFVSCNVIFSLALPIILFSAGKLRRLI